MGARSVGNDCLWKVTNILKITLGEKIVNTKQFILVVG